MPVQIQEIKHRLNGSSQSFLCDLLYRSTEALVLRFQATGTPYAAVARTTEGFFWQGRNYLVYRMFDQDGALVGHRIDVCRDVRFGQESIEWTDLLLDLFITPAGELRVLDEDEVASAITAGLLSPQDQEIIARTRALLEADYQAVVEEAARLWQPGAGFASPSAGVL